MLKTFVVIVPDLTLIVTDFAWDYAVNLYVVIVPDLTLIVTIIIIIISTLNMCRNRARSNTHCNSGVVDPLLYRLESSKCENLQKTMVELPKNRKISVEPQPSITHSEVMRE